ncbi:MAG TPA: glycoside hydrolase family 172 protein [Fimbriimonadaceae bacterium]|nr:glycoside hydrolase family 172 protein [Fimbriimonadaceae bacterium]
MNLYEKPAGVQTHWISFENGQAERGRAGLENRGAKGHAFDSLRAGETKTLLDVNGSGQVCRIWATIGDRSPEMLRSLRLEMFWDGSERPAVSVPFGDFFGVGLGRRVPFENALFSDPEGRSFNCFIPMPFRTAARVTLTNDSDRDLNLLFYDVDLLLGVQHSPETLYFHACWRRESPNALGEEFLILPKVVGSGRFLGCNVGVIADPAYEGSWWGEGEVKVRFGDDPHPTLCGTGTEDYIGAGWGQGAFAHRTQGCLVADKEAGHWAFYRFHLDDPVYFDDACQVSIQTMGGNETRQVLEFLDRGVPLTPVTIDTGAIGGFLRLCESERTSSPLRGTGPVNLNGTKENRDDEFRDLRLPEYADKWCNFWRQDDWSATAYYYLDSP